MDKIFCKQSFMTVQLLVMTGMIVFMVVPPTFGCNITEVTLYAGADGPDAEEADCEFFYIGVDGDVVFHAICEGVTNDEEYRIRWEFNFADGGATIDCTEETSYDPDENYLKRNSCTANYDNAGTIYPSVTCYFIDSEGIQVGDVVFFERTVEKTVGFGGEEVIVFAADGEVFLGGDLILYRCAPLGVIDDLQKIVLILVRLQPKRQIVLELGRL